MRLCTSDKLLGDAKAVDLWTTLNSKELAQDMQMSPDPKGVVAAALRTSLKVLSLIQGPTVHLLRLCLSQV